MEEQNESASNESLIVLVSEDRTKMLRTAYSWTTSIDTRTNMQANLSYIHRYSGVVYIDRAGPAVHNKPICDSSCTFNCVGLFEESDVNLSVMAGNRQNYTYMPPKKPSDQVKEV